MVWIGPSGLHPRPFISIGLLSFRIAFGLWETRARCSPIALTSVSPSSPPPTTNHLYAVAGNESEIIIAGDQAVLRRGSGSGEWTWQSHRTDPVMAPVWPYYSAVWDGRLFLLGGRIGLLAEGFRPEGAADLQWFAPSQPTRNWLWDVTRAPGFYAASGDLGTIVTSDDGVNWSREAVPLAALDKVLLGIGGNSNRLVSVGAAGAILLSPSVITNTYVTNSVGDVETVEIDLMGIVWNQVSSPTTNDLQGVAASQSLLVVTGARGTILTSADGQEWTPRNNPMSTFLSGAAAWPGGFVAVGDLGTILTSPDGFTWTQRNSGVTNWIYRVAHANGTFVAAGEGGLILTSSNATAWHRRESGTTAWLNDVTHAAGQWFIAGGGGQVLTSPDGIDWSLALAPTSRSLYGLATDGAQVIAAGMEGAVLRHQAAPLLAPLSFAVYQHSSGTNLFLIEGLPDQRFVLEARDTLQDPWQPIAELEILDPDGDLIHLHDSSGQPSSFFRTRSLP